MLPSNLMAQVYTVSQKRVTIFLFVITWSNVDKFGIECHAY